MSFFDVFHLFKLLSLFFILSHDTNKVRMNVRQAELNYFECMKKQENLTDLHSFHSQKIYSDEHKVSPSEALSKKD